MKIKTPSNAPLKTCKECQAGQMNQQFVTYFTWLGSDWITVPDFPAWVCDVCYRTEYDSRALRRLNLLLATNAGRSTHPAHQHHHREDTRPSPPRKLGID